MDSLVMRVSLAGIILLLIGALVVYNVWLGRRYRKPEQPGAGSPSPGAEGDHREGAAPAPAEPAVRPRT